MLRRHFKVAITQGAHEIAHTFEATESQRIASKVKSAGVQLTKHQLKRSLPLIDDNRSKVLSDKQFAFGMVRLGRQNEGGNQ